MSNVVPYAVGAYRAYKRARRVYEAAAPHVWAMSKGRTGGGRRKVRGSRTRFAKAVRKVIMSTAEKCYKSTQKDGNFCHHDTTTAIAVWTPTQTTFFPSQGSGDGERRGDEIYATGIMIRGVFQIPQDRRNTKFKMWWVMYDENQQGAISKANLASVPFLNVPVNLILTLSFTSISDLPLLYKDFS